MIWYELKMIGNTVLITGVTGYLGCRVAQALDAAGFRVIGLIRRSSDPFAVKRAIPKIEFLLAEDSMLSGQIKDRDVHQVIHCATHYGRTDPNPDRVRETNVEFPYRLLRQSIEAGVRTFINTDTVLNAGISVYSSTKKDFLALFQTTSDQIECINIALDHFYGPGDGNDKFVTDVIRKLLRSVDSIPLTPGGQQRDFTHVDDVVRAFVTIAKHVPLGHPRFVEIQAGSGRIITIRALIELIRGTIGNDRTRLEFGALPYRSNEMMASQMDLQMIHSLGWLPQISLEEGLRSVVAFERERIL